MKRDLARLHRANPVSPRVFAVAPFQPAGPEPDVHAGPRRLERSVGVSTRHDAIRRRARCNTRRTAVDRGPGVLVVRSRATGNAAAVPAQAPMTTGARGVSG